MNVCGVGTPVFLSTLFAPPFRVPGQFVELSGWTGGGKRPDGSDIPKGGVATHFVGLGEPDWLSRTVAIAERLASEGKNVYFGAAPRFRTAEAGHRSKNDDVDRLAALWVDVDAPKDENGQYADANWKSKARARFENLPVQPSIRIDSGHGYHLYWLLKEPLLDLEAGKSLLERMILAIGGDRAGKNVSRLLRLPGPPNVKNPDVPVMTGVDFCRDSMRFDLSYLAEAWPVVVEKKPRKASSSVEVKAGRKLSAVEIERIALIWTDGQRHEACLAICGAMRKAGWEEADVTEAVLAISEVAGGDVADRRLIVRTTFAAQDLDKLLGWERLRELGVRDGDLPSLDRPLKNHGGGGGGKTADGFHTDMGNARAFVDDQVEGLRFAEDMQQWFAWDEQRWSMNAVGSVEQAAKSVVLRLYREALEMPTDDEADVKARDQALRWARKSQGMGFRQAMIKTAAYEPELRIWSRELDQQPFFLNVANGTVDLRTGELHEHRREDLLTRLSPITYEPNAECRRWEEFLLEVFRGDLDLCHFIQLAVGYTLTGNTREQCIFMMHGSGSNGKSTFIETLKSLVGDLAETTPFETFTVRQGDRGVPNDLAKLRGARLVTAVEAEEGARFSEALIKSLTGQDTITARFLNKEFFDFVPAFKLWLAANHKPVIRGTDHAIWRRIKLIPFEAQFEGDKKDPFLAEKLKSELPGILAWAVKGARMWFSAGLPSVKAIEDATQEYRSESDVIGRFLEGDQLVRVESFSIKARRLYELYRSWATEAGERVVSETKFGRVMGDKGLKKVGLKAGNFYLGFGETAASGGGDRRYAGGDF